MTLACLDDYHWFQTVIFFGPVLLAIAGIWAMGRRRVDHTEDEEGAPPDGRRERSALVEPVHQNSRRPIQG